MAHIAKDPNQHADIQRSQNGLLRNAPQGRSITGQWQGGNALVGPIGTPQVNPSAISTVRMNPYVNLSRGGK